MKRINLRHAAIATALTGAALLAGCGGPKEPPINENNMSDFVETSNALDDMNLTEPTPTPTATPTPVTGNASSPEFTQDSQTLDDAAATGMTAKLPQDNGTAPAQH